MRFSTVTLLYFVEVCREKGFSQAAAKLDKSQSAVSTQIALLEKILSDSQDRLCLFISPKHVLAKKRSMNITDLDSTLFVVGPKGTEYTEMITRALAHHRLFSYRVAARISNFEGVKEVVHAGLGVGLLPHFMIRREIQEGTLKQLKIEGFVATAAIMHIERLQQLATPTMIQVKKFLTAAVPRV